MIICINCNTDIKGKMDELLSKKDYKNYSELIALAIQNLWMLEGEIATKGSLVIRDNLQSPVSGSPLQGREGETGTVPRVRLQSRQRRGPSIFSSPATHAPAGIPNLFLIDSMDTLTAPAFPIQPEKSSVSETFMLGSWLFGQYNKLLPAKANCRALLRLIGDNVNGVYLHEAVKRITEDAALLGDYLADHDCRHEIGRDDALATAFPRSGPESQKSRARYANQFVGGVNSRGQLSGLLSDYRLACLAPGNQARLLVTQQGMGLARLPNPVLDRSHADPLQKFSPEEVAFLLDHIHTFVPVEEFAFRTLLNAIAEDMNTPEKIDEVLRPLVPTGSSFSPSFLASQRSGALSRMADLGLISRVRRGVRVEYHIAEYGEGFRSQTNSKNRKEIGQS